MLKPNFESVSNDNEFSDNLFQVTSDSSCGNYLEEKSMNNETSNYEIHITRSYCIDDTNVTIENINKEDM